MNWYSCHEYSCSNNVSQKMFFCQDCAKTWSKDWGHWKRKNDIKCRCCNYDEILDAFVLQGEL